MSPVRSRRSKIFGAILKELRTTKGLSQEKLAHGAGKNRTAVSGWEGGEHSPTLDTLFALAGALEISASEIVRRIEAADQ